MRAFLGSTDGAITIDQVALGAALIVVALGVVDLASEEGGVIIDIIQGEGLGALFEGLAPAD
ncbi:MAG: hypothetical protein AAGE83_02555 [Pseudomonadota bacterium]